MRRTISFLLATLALLIAGFAVTTPAYADGNCKGYGDGSLCVQQFTVNVNNQRSSVTVRYSGTNAPHYYIGRGVTAYFLCGNVNGANYIYVHSGYDVRIKWYDENGNYRTANYTSTGWHLLPYSVRSPQCTRKKTVSPLRLWGVIDDIWEHKQ